MARSFSCGPRASGTHVFLQLTAGTPGMAPRCTVLVVSGQSAHRFDALLEFGSLSTSGLPRGCASRAGQFRPDVEVLSWLRKSLRK
jgi:hypothetical protein